MAQLKPPTTYNQQIEKLRSRGCQVTDVSFCSKVLSQINYYRLSAYFLPFKKPDGNYLPGTDFNDIYQIYEFDRELRNLLFAAIEEVEIYLRSQFAYFHAHKYGATGYLSAANYNTRHRHDKFQQLIEAEIQNNRKVLFVQHHLANYGGNFQFGLLQSCSLLVCCHIFITICQWRIKNTSPRSYFRQYPKALPVGLDAVPI